MIYIVREYTMIKNERRIDFLKEDGGLKSMKRVEQATEEKKEEKAGGKKMQFWGVMIVAEEWLRQIDEKRDFILLIFLCLMCVCVFNAQDLMYKI